jgi:hypothetical protein
MILKVVHLSFESDRYLGNKLLILFILDALLAEVGETLVNVNEMKRTP